MSRIIKAFQITGKHQLEDIDPVAMTDEQLEEMAEVNNEKETLDYEDKQQLLKEARQEAASIIDKAEQQAEQIRKKADKDAERIKEEARKKGFSEGREEGHREVIENCQQKINNLEKVLAELRKQKEKENEALTAQVISLAVKISEKIISSSLELNPELIKEIVFDMVSDINETYESIEIKVAPELIDFLDEEEIKALLDAEDIDFTGKQSLEKGDCIIETDFGGRDGVIANKLELLEEELYKGAGYHD